MRTLHYTRGAALYHWTLDKPAEQVNHWSFFPPGDCLMVTYDRWVVLYHCKTGTIERSLDVLNMSDGTPVPMNYHFVANIARVGTMDYVMLFFSDKFKKQAIFAISNRRILLVIHNWLFDLYQNNYPERTQNWTQTQIDRGILDGHIPRHHWYDEKRGLIVTANHAALTVHRITKSCSSTLRNM